MYQFYEFTFITPFVRRNNIKTPLQQLNIEDECNKVLIYEYAFVFFLFTLFFFFLFIYLFIFFLFHKNDIKLK